jgi:putative DNA primase/helicase
LLAEALARQQELSAAAPGRRWIDFQRERDISDVPGTYINAKIAVLNCGLHCRYDTFHNRLIVEEFACSENGDVNENLDNIEAKVRDRVIAKFGFDPHKNHVHDAVLSVALANTFDPVREYLDGLRWDGHEQIDRWVVDRMGGLDTSLNRAVGRKMLVAAVRRVRRQGN